MKNWIKTEIPGLTLMCIQREKEIFLPKLARGKLFSWVLIVVVIGWFLIEGYTTDDRYFQILGLSVLGVIVFSALVGMVRKERWSFWDSWIFFDGVELLFQIIVGIIRLEVEIVADKD